MKKQYSVRNGPDLDRFLEGRKDRYTTFLEGSHIYGMNHFTFTRLAKKAKAIIRGSKNSVVDMEIMDKYLEENLKEGSSDVYFICGLCHNGLLGGGLIVDEWGGITPK